MHSDRNSSSMTAMTRAAACAGAVVATSSPAWACPSCSLGDFNTLVYILAFLFIPYLVVSCVWLWIRRILASESS